MVAKSRAVKLLVRVDQPRGHAPGFLWGACLAVLSATYSGLVPGASSSMGPFAHPRPPGLAGRGVVLGRGPHPQGGAADGAGAHGDHRPLARRVARHAALRVDRGAPRECARVVHGVPWVPPSRPAPRAPLRLGTLPAL